jgi:PTS system cellobiose-specific IIB component
MKKAAEARGEAIDIRATVVANFPEFEDKTDILLLAPQVGYLAKKMKEKYEPRGIKVAVINSVDYGMMNGEQVLKNVLTM